MPCSGLAVLRKEEWNVLVELIQSGGKPGGIGEVGVPLVAPAVANAVFALTGKRIRTTPLEDGGVHFG